MKRKLLKIFGATILVRFLIFAFGPYRYTIESSDGLLYMVFVDILFAFGLFIGNYIKSYSYGVNNENYILQEEITDRRKRFIIAFEVISILVFGLWLLDWSRNIGFQYLFSNEDVRRLVSERRTMISRLSEFLVPLGVIPFFETHLNECYNNTKCKSISNVSLFLPGIISFASGARWGIILCIVYFIIIFRQNRSSKARTPLNIKKLIYFTVCVIIFIYIMAYIMALFESRGINHGANRYLFHPGDMQLKPFWKSLLDWNYSMFEPVFGLSSYIAQPIPVFSHVYSTYQNTSVFYGVNMFRVFALILQTLGITTFSIKTMYNAVFSGLYTSYIYGYIIDFGYILSPLLILITGIVFGKIESGYCKHGRYNILYPMVKAMVLFAPYYYFFQVGCTDYVLFWLFFYSLMLKTRVRIKTSN